MIGAVRLQPAKLPFQPAIRAPSQYPLCHCGSQEKRSRASQTEHNLSELHRDYRGLRALTMQPSIITDREITILHRSKAMRSPTKRELNGILTRRTHQGRRAICRMRI